MTTVGASPYLLTPEAAAFLGVSVRTLHEWTRLQRVPHRKPPGGRRCLYLEAELRAWLDGAPLEHRQLPRGGRAVIPIARAGRQDRNGCH